MTNLKKLQNEARENAEKGIRSKLRYCNKLLEVVTVITRVSPKWGCFFKYERNRWSNLIHPVVDLINNEGGNENTAMFSYTH